MKKNLLLSLLILSSLSITSCGEDKNSSTSQESSNSNTQESLKPSADSSNESSNSETASPSETESTELSQEESTSPSESSEEESTIPSESESESVEPSEPSESESVDPTPTIETISIARAIEIASSLPVGKDKEGDHISTSQYTVTGTLIVDGNNYSLTDGEDTIKLYYFLNNEDKNLVHGGYEVTVTGYLENYGYSADAGTPEIVNFTVDNYTSVNYTVVIPTFENGTITGTTSNIEYGTEVTYTVTVNAGYKIEWIKFNNNIVDASSGTFTVKVEKNSEITASFVLKSAEVAKIVEFKIADFASANNWEDKTKYTEFSANDVTVSCTNNGKFTGTYYESNGTWRIYSSESATVTITLADGFELESVTITYTQGDLTGYASGTEVATSGSTVTIAAKAKTFITSIVVKYNKAN